MMARLDVTSFGRMFLTPSLPRPRPWLLSLFLSYSEVAMTPRITRNLRMPAQPGQLTVVHPHAAGIDIGAAEHWVAVPADCDPQPVRRFGACTPDLHALADWLQRCGVTTVALESTGVYWIPLFELLESRGLQVLLVDPHQVRHAPGRPKTDVKDCQWLQRLHAYGLLTGAFRPEDQVVVLRSYLRQRQMLIVYAGQHLQHMQKALEQMNVKLPEVVSDITGVTGMRIIKAILAGQRDPATLAKLRDRRCKQDEAAIARALQGNWRAEHLFALQQALALYEFYHQQLAECHRVLEQNLRSFEDRSQGQPLPYRPRQRKRGANEPVFDARTHLYRMCGVDLTVIEGIEAGTALVLIGEIGTDLSRWPSLKQFCSWLGLCPQHKITGGKVFSRRTRRVTNRAAQALRLAARSLHHSKSALGAFFRRMKSRLGAPKAVTATAHKLARLVYSLLKNGTAYVAQAMEEYERTYREKTVQNLTRKAKALGYQLVAVDP
jgi:transposase